MNGHLFAVYDFNGLGATFTGLVAAGFLAYRLVISHKKAIESDYHKEQVEYLDEAVKARDEIIASKDAQIERQNTDIRRLNAIIDDARTRRVEEIAKGDAEVERIVAVVRDLRKDIAAKEDKIDELELRISKYETP